jgi:periodic tryptophan protein 2
MNFRLANLLGAPYRGGTLTIVGNELLTPVGNRVTQVRRRRRFPPPPPRLAQLIAALTSLTPLLTPPPPPTCQQIDLEQSTAETLPFESASNVRALAASPDGRLLVAVDADGRALVVNRRRRALLHRFSFKGIVRAAAFSPCGAYLAVAVGRLVQVWRRPEADKSVAPFALHRTYGHAHADITCLDWSADSCWLAAGGKDLMVRVWSLQPIAGYKPPALGGHKEAPVAVHFAGAGAADAARLLGKEPVALYSVARDGALHAWSYEAAAGPAAAETGSEGAEAEEAEEASSSGSDSDADANAAAPAAKRRRASASAADAANPPPFQSRTFSGGRWRLTEKHYFRQRGGAHLSAAAFHAGAGVLAAGFSTGLFELLQLPDLQTIHTLSVGRERVTSLAFNAAGDWLALGAAALGQLLVWEWRSESYVLKQQGHAADVSSLAFSPDGALLATGAADHKVKVWTPANGFCFVTFADHAAPVTAVAFAPSGAAVLSASLDGTVRAYDLVRYRNFRTLTTPEPAQFSCLALDPGGDVVVAGTSDGFQIFAWSLRTGRLLDALAGHEGPVVGLAFAPNSPLLASASWDKTVRTWDVFAGKGSAEVLQHSHDVLALAWRPDGRQLASSTLDGQIYLWDPAEAELQATIAGRRDVAGGRLRGDRRAAANTSSGRAFTSLAYSADGSFLLAGGASKYVCLYDVAERVLLRRFQITANRALDGVLDQLNSKRMHPDAGPLDALEDGDSEEEDAPGAAPPPPGGALPGTRARAPAAARSRAVALAPTGRAWAAASSEGVLMYSLDDSLVFDPTDLAEDVTPAAVLRALAAGAHLRGLLLALRLGDAPLVRHALLATPPAGVGGAAAALPPALAPRVLGALGEALGASPHAEHLLRWAREVCGRHGGALAAAGGAGGAAGAARPALRALAKALARLQEDLQQTAEANLYELRYLVAAGRGGAAAEAADVSV